MTAPFPHHYRVELDGRVLAAPPRAPIAGGAPPQFGGKDVWWSPEELLLGAVALCLMTTFQALATRAGVAVRAYSSQVEGVLDKTAAGLTFTSIRVQVAIVVDADAVARAETLIHSAEKHCIVSNSLKTPPTVEASISAAT